MAQGQIWHIPKASQAWSKYDRMALRRITGMDGGTKMTPIKKAIRTIALLTQRLSQLNFNSKAEIIEAYEIEKQLSRIEEKNRNKRFEKLSELFRVEGFNPFEDETVRHAEQVELLWKLVDLKSSQHE